MTAQDTLCLLDIPAPSTQARLQLVAQTLFWSRGYSNVPLRDIARGAGVDVALIGRYFGSKEGLFDQTLHGAFDVIPDPSTMQRFGRDGLIDFVIDLFTRDAAGGQGAPPSVVDLVAMNGHDPAIGGKVMAQQRRHIHAPLTAILGSDARAELFWAVIIGCCITQNAATDRAAGFSPKNTAQLRHMLQAAANFGQANT
jgi:AcrR family transcriptional regulator